MNKRGSNKLFYTLIVLALLVLFGLISTAFTYQEDIPLPGHGADEIWVKTFNGEKDLQQAVDEGDIGAWKKDAKNIYYNEGGAKVGIGRSNPTYSLDVLGDVRLSSLLFNGHEISTDDNNPIEISNLLEIKSGMNVHDNLNVKDNFCIGDKCVNAFPNSFDDPPICTGKKSLQWDGNSWKCVKVASDNFISGWCRIYYSSDYGHPYRCEAYGEMKCIGISLCECSSSEYLKIMINQETSATLSYDTHYDTGGHERELSGVTNKKVSEDYACINPR